MIKSNAPVILLKALLDGSKVSIGDSVYCLAEDDQDIVVAAVSDVRGEVLLRVNYSFKEFLRLAGKMTEEELSNTAAGNALRQILGVNRG